MNWRICFSRLFSKISELISTWLLVTCLCRSRTEIVATIDATKERQNNGGGDGTGTKGFYSGLCLVSMVLYRLCLFGVVEWS